MAKDLRHFIEVLREKAPDQYAEVEREVDPRLEVTAIIGRVERVRGMDAPLLFFRRVKGSSFPLVANAYFGYRKMAIAMGVGEDGLLDEYLRRKANPIKPREISDGPCKDVILKGDEIDVARFPIVTTSPLDDAPYITTAVTMAMDIDNKEFPLINLGIYRHRLIDRRRIGIYYSWGKYIHYLHKKAEERGKALEVALAIGLHPCITTAATDQGHLHELELAGALMGEPVELVRCETVDLWVPADAEIVIEGYIPPGVRQREGPYGEYAGYYGQLVDAPVIEITCITHREGAIYQHASSGKHAENVFFLGMEADMLATLRRYFPTVKRVHLPFLFAPYFCFIQMSKMNEGDPISAGLMACGMNQFVKYAVVVDEDVNIYDLSEVMWAIATRARADEDFVVVPRAKGNRLDPTTYTRLRDCRDSMVTKLVIDATTKTGLPYELPQVIKEPMINQINLEDYGIKI